MDFKLLSKNNLGILATLILVILLSQSRFLDFLIQTPLGRIVLLGLIIFIAYTNKLFGLLAVLFIILAFNQNEINVVKSYSESVYEGFDVDLSGNETLTDEQKAKAQTVKENVDKKKQSVSDMIQPTTTSSSVPTTATEGFCITDKELNILRGKQSNTVPVFNKSRQQKNEVDPSDKSIFSNLYASF